MTGADAFAGEDRQHRTPIRQPLDYEGMVFLEACGGQALLAL